MLEWGNVAVARQSAWDVRGAWRGRCGGRTPPRAPPGTSRYDATVPPSPKHQPKSLSQLPNCPRRSSVVRLLKQRAVPGGWTRSCWINSWLKTCCARTPFEYIKTMISYLRYCWGSMTHAPGLVASDCYCYFFTVLAELLIVAYNLHTFWFYSSLYIFIKISMCNAIWHESNQA